MRLCWVLLSVAVSLLCVQQLCAAATVQVWMGLERTGENIQHDLQQLQDHKETISSVSFEQYNLGANSQLIHAKLSDVGPILRTNFLTFPMISTYNDTAPNRRPTDIIHCREVFADPSPFIQQCLEVLETEGFTGMNVDFEPSGGDATDAENYAKFLTQFASSLHAKGFKLSVDISSWDAIWNWTLIAQSGVDQAIIMDTYTGNFDIFQQRLSKGVANFGVDQLVVGLMTLNPNTNQPFSEPEVKERFQLLQKSGIKHISLWEMPVPDVSVVLLPLRFCVRV